ncbi:GLYATL3.2 family protein [Megaselia abdita]
MSAQSFEIPRIQWVKIRDMYLTDWPKYSITFSLIDHALKNNQNDIKLYCYCEDLSDGSFVYVNRSYGIIHCNTFSEDLQKLKNILNRIEDLGLQFIIITSKSLLPIAEHVSALTNLKYEQPTDILFHMDKTKALEIEIPKHKDVILKPLTLESVEVVNNYWPHSYPGSLEYINNLISTDFSMGAFDKITGELMAWILRYPTGCFGMLQVKKEHLRKGLGKLVTLAITKKLAELGLDSTATTIHDNLISRKLFNSIGFTEQFEVFLFEWTI